MPAVMQLTAGPASTAGRPSATATATPAAPTAATTGTSTRAGARSTPTAGS
eukprot:CAMPEP_0168410162 /NCGR_PEP_ID=MMETSP0228-20121227/27551_1 /TAXON_ID=133427 /ORGANISM="Protoceratium reticulatum, Strain CCCM 535 (=CCMP 1889)" /LENGTH=50 /DNA_ID=CAMNT_0008423885 /DNA_START=60 /DNA_END=212 /DNA_ORIENTATION=-